jgi:hypothetical protein
MATVASAMKPGLSALHDFSSLLNHALEAIDDSVLDLRSSLHETVDKLGGINKVLINHEDRIKKLETETDEQREITEKAMKLAAMVEKNVDGQLNDTAKNFHKELLMNRTLNKMDITALKNRLSEKLGTLSSLANGEKIYNPDENLVHNPNSAPEETVKYLLDKVHAMEKSLDVQNDVNKEISNAILNDEVLQKVYDSVFDQVSGINHELENTKQENERLKQMLKEMKSSQHRHDKAIRDILNALSSREKLKQLRSDLINHKKHKGHVREDDDTNMDDLEPFLDEEETEMTEDGEIIHKRSQSTISKSGRRRRTEKTRKSYEVQLMQIDEQQDGEEGAPSVDDDEAEDNDDLRSDSPGKRNKPILTARLSTLVRREIPKKKLKRNYVADYDDEAEEEIPAADEEIYEESAAAEVDDAGKSKALESKSKPVSAKSENETQTTKEVPTENVSASKPKIKKAKSTPSSVPTRQSDEQPAVTQAPAESIKYDDEVEEEDEELEEAEPRVEVTEEVIVEEVVVKAPPKPKAPKPKKDSSVIRKVKQIKKQRRIIEVEDDEDDEDEGNGDEDDVEEEVVYVKKKRGTKVQQNRPSKFIKDEPIKPRDHRLDTARVSAFYRGSSVDAHDEETRPSNMVKQKSPTHQSSHQNNEAKSAPIETETLPSTEVTTTEPSAETKEFQENNESVGDDGSFATLDESIFFGSESVSYANEDSSIGRHLIEVLENNNVEMAGVINNLRDDYNRRISSLESAVGTFKRIAFVIDDLKIGFDTVRNKVDTVVSNESIDEKLNRSMLDRIAKLKESWARIYSELVFALENLNDNEFDKPDARNVLSGELHPFFQKAKELSYALEDGLDDFTPRETLELTLKKLFPSLDRIHEIAEDMVNLDDKARNSASLDYCFDDLLCSDLTPSLRGLIADASISSLPVLDEGVAKIKLQRRLNRVTRDMEKKPDKVDVAEMESDLKRLLHQKVDVTEFMTITSKLASSTELQRLSAMITDGHAAGLGTAIHHEPPKPLMEQPEFLQLLERFNSLANKQFELEAKTDKLVPKDEVHEALKAVVSEIKNLRKNCVLMPVFREGLKTKADATEVDR